MSAPSSYRQILRSSSIIGGASVINILIGLIRNKAAAMLLGPTGIGLIGILQSLIATASTASSLGLNSSATRQIAEAATQTDNKAMASVRRALFLATLGLATTGAFIFWLLRDILAKQVLNDVSLTSTVGWLAVGVALTVASGSQAALLNGLRRIGDIARISVLSALLSTAIGVGALLIWGKAGILGYILAAPIASFLLHHHYVSTLPVLAQPSTALPQLIEQMRTMTRLGLSIMFAGLVVIVGQLIVRSMVQRELGPEALGYFQAAWTISMTYIGFVLQAMGTDYYPRLTAVIHDKIITNRMVNEQTEVALLLSGPILLAMLGSAPWIIDLLYSNQFSEAETVLRWHVIGDILKIVSWPLGFILLASGDGKAFLLTELLGITVFATLTWIGLPLLGINATGIAFLGMYIAYLSVMFQLTRRRTGFRWNTNISQQLITLLVFASLVFTASYWSKFAGLALSICGSTIFGIYSVKRLTNMVSPNGRLGHLTTIMQRGTEIFGPKRN